MAYTLSILSIPLNGTGTEIPTLSVLDSYAQYNVTGTVVATGNYSFVSTGTPTLGTTFVFKWMASLDLTSNSKTLSIFGQSITDVQATKKGTYICTYNGSSWDVEFDPSFTQSGIVETNNIQTAAITNSLMAANSVATANIQNSAVDTAELADGSVTTSKLASNAVTTVKVTDANITTAKIADLNVTTAKINDNAITNAKLAQMASNTVKGNNTGVTADPQDIPISTMVNNVAWNLIGNSGTTAGTNFIGTTDTADLVFKWNSIESGRVNSSAKNTSLGVRTLVSNVSANDTTALGYNTLTAVTTGDNNTAIGSEALIGVTTGGANTAIGWQSGAAITTGSNNTLIGLQADVDSISSSNRIALGSGALADADNQFAIPDTVTKIKWRGVSYTLPATDGTVGQKLTTDGAGNLSWT